MKAHLYLIIFLTLSSFFSCQDEEQGIGGKGIGYLTLNVGTSSATNTRATVYNPKQIAVQIINLETEKVEEETDDWETWKGEKFALEAGKYAIVASSAGFDGSSPEFEKPYYEGADTVDITPNTSQTAEITCRLANVKLTVDFSFFKENKFKAASVEVKAGSSSLTFSLGSPSETKAGYFPVKSLTANLTVTNKNGVVHTLKTPIEDAKARDHIILKYKSGDAEGGTSGITVTVDESTKTYTYVIPVELKEVAAGLDATSVNAWAKFAYLEGTATVKGMELDNSLVKLQYKEADASDWIPLDAVMKEDVYKATATALTPATSYQYRMYYKNGDTEFVSDTIAFTTEEQTLLPNANFDEWWRKEEKDSSPWYAISSEGATSSTFDDEGNLFSFWDSGNGGTVMMSKNPTQPEDTDVHTAKGKSAKLSSQFVGIDLGLIKPGKFAAGNIFTGHFCKANISTYQARIMFGQPFTSRPTQLKGWFKYNRGTTVDYPDGTDSRKTELQNSGGDQCSIYIALTDNVGVTYEEHNYAYEINGDLSGDDAANFKYKNAIDFSESNKDIIAYGTISEDEAKGSGDWQEFTIDLKYRDLTRKPKYIIVVASASKYGDFFTGSTSSVMYIDDFELVYDGEPKTEE